MGGVVSSLAFPGVNEVTVIPELSDTFCRVETDNLSVPCLQALRKDARLSLVYCHGNAMSIRELTERVKQISMDLQCNVFIPEIPGVLFCSMDTCLDHPVQSVGRELCGGGGGRVRHGGGALSGAAGGDLGPVAGHGRGVRAGRATPSRLRSRAAEPAALLSQGPSFARVHKTNFVSSSFAGGESVAALAVGRRSLCQLEARAAHCHALPRHARSARRGAFCLF
jgi:hypothetical protein